MKFRTFLLTGLTTLAALCGFQARADNMASIAVAPATGAVTLTPRWALGGNLAGFHFMAQNWGLTGGSAEQFYSIKNTPIPAGGDTLAFNFYVAGSGTATPHADIGSKLAPNTYSALTSADPDLGYGSVNQYLIHHKGTTDYLTVIKPGAATASTVTDLKPMSGPGGPDTVTGVSGYFGLTFAAANLDHGLNLFYYLRTDPVTGTTKFGSLVPSLAGTASDHDDLAISGHNALAFSGDDVGFGTAKMYYLRLDPITGYTIFGTLQPGLNPAAGTRRAADIANLGSVYSTLTYVPGDVGFGSGKFYTTGSVNAEWQSVSFASINDRLIGAGSFPVTPSASSNLPITLSVVTGSTGAASISGPVAGVFTVTPTAPGLITLQATQAGQLVAPLYDYNMLRQSFTATGATLLAITTQPTARSVVTGNTATFTVATAGTSPRTYQWRKAGVNITGNASATTATLSLTNSQAAAAASYDVVVTNDSGSIISDAVLLTVTAGSPVITNSPLTAPGNVGTAFSFTITASGSPTSFTASPLPAGLSLAAATGVISGTPTTVGTTNVLLGATNSTGTGNATLVVTVAAAGVAPIITNTPLSAGATVGTVFNFTITASGTPTSYTATPLPAGLSIVAATGAITGTPTTAGTTNVLLGATNSTGTGNATLVITVAAAGVAPIINNSPLTAAGTVGTPFSFAISAAGSPTSYTATPLPAGLSLVAATGVITGTPTAIGTTNVLLGATNGIGTGNATLVVTVAAAGVAPIISNRPLTAAGSVGTAFSFTITASGLPTSYTAAPLPAGLSIVAATGAITGSPTTVGTTNVLLGATNSTGTGNATLVITIAAAGVAPNITNNPLTAAGTVGTPFSFTITASGTPTSYSASPRPAGLSIVAATGAITGTPTSAGTTHVVLGATNSFGTDNATLTITIASAGVAPTITNNPLTAAGTVGTPFSFQLTAAGSAADFSAVGLPAGLTLNPFTGAVSGTPTESGTSSVTFEAWNDEGSDSKIVAITIAAATVTPVITSPTVASGTAGTPFVTYIIAATGLPTSYTATGLPSGLSLNPLTGAINGTATLAGTSLVVITATNSAGTSTINLVITIAPAPGAASRIVNFSARALSGPGDKTLIMGFVVAGGAKNILVRGVGPTLALYGVTNVLADPTLTLHGPSGIIATNDDWQIDSSGANVSALMAETAAQVGAGALPDGSKDSALLFRITSGAHTTSMLRSASTEGVAVTEIYDTDAETVGGRLINVSARMNVSAGEGALIAGFVITGEEPKDVLIRGLGPNLATAGVTGVLIDPKITVFSNGAIVAANDNWETGTSTPAQIVAKSALVGAGALEAGTKDAALLVTLPPGIYTVQVTSVTNTPGVALVEVYDADTL